METDFLMSNDRVTNFKLYKCFTVKNLWVLIFPKDGGQGRDITFVMWGLVYRVYIKMKSQEDLNTKLNNLKISSIVLCKTMTALAGEGVIYYMRATSQLKKLFLYTSTDVYLLGCSYVHVKYLTNVIYECTTHTKSSNLPSISDNCCRWRCIYML